LLGLPQNMVDLPGAIYTAVMEADAAALERGLDTLIGTRGVKLSGGQAQRTAAARMLVRDTELLVFDDISGSLYVKTEHTLWTRLFTTGERTQRPMHSKRVCKGSVGTGCRKMRACFSFLAGAWPCAISSRRSSRSSSLNFTIYFFYKNQYLVNNFRFKSWIPDNFPQVTV
jgi:hypothetical protein